MSAAALIALLQLTLTNPRAAAAAIKAMKLPIGFGVTALVLMSVISAFMGYLGFVLSGDTIDPAYAALFGSPLRIAFLQLVALALTGVLAHWVGARFGGRGSLADALVLVAWVQLPPILLQAAQMLLIFAAPGLAALLGIAGFALYAVLLSLFVAELHGFRSALWVFFGLIVISILVAIALAMLMFILIGVVHG